jgi:hypothetical protein
MQDSKGEEVGPPADGEVSETHPDKRPDMRTKRDTQDWLDFQPSNLQLTNEYFGRYEAISVILDATPALLELVHRDLEAALEQEKREGKRRGGFVYTSEMVLRLALCQDIEGLSLREVVVRVDDSHYLERRRAQ